MSLQIGLNLALHVSDMYKDTALIFPDHIMRFCLQIRLVGRNICDFHVIFPPLFPKPCTQSEAVRRRPFTQPSPEIHAEKENPSDFFSIIETRCRPSTHHNGSDICRLAIPELSFPVTHVSILGKTYPNFVHNYLTQNKTMTRTAKLTDPVLYKYTVLQ